MVFPFIVIASLGALIGNNVPIATSYNVTSSNYYSNADVRDYKRTYVLNINGIPTIDYDNTFYFLSNPNDRTECLASLRVQKTFNFVDYYVDYTYTLEATTLANCAWIGSIGGVGIEEYEQTNYISYSICFYDGYSRAGWTLDMGHSYQTTSYTQRVQVGQYVDNHSTANGVVLFDVSINNYNATTMWNNGYTFGLQDNEHWSLDNYLYSIFDLPVLYLRSMFGFELFGGISLFGVIISLVTIALIAFIIKKFI